MEIAEPNWARGFRQGWEVAEEYEIIAGVLRMKGAIRRVYSPMMHPEIPWKLAKLRRGDEAGLLEFARTYGRLGYSNLVEPERRRGGDPLPWIWLHVETLQMCMNLLYFLQEKDEERDVDRLAGYLRSLCGPFPFPVDHEHWPAAIVAERGTSRAHFWRFPATPKQLAYSAYYDVQEIEGLAQKICIDVVNANVGVD